MPAQDWLLVDSGPGAADFNMALDEALLESMPRLNRPVVRFYGWALPAATFGYFQKYLDIERLTPLRPLLRRPTGGGLVPHDYDWTYSVAFPPNHEWYSLKAVESYRRIHSWIQLAFARLDFASQLAPDAARVGPGQCFLGFERFDLLWKGQKIAGAAQRRRRDGLLIQGSVQPPSASITRTDWQKAMCFAGEQQYAMGWGAWTPDPQASQRATELVATKYSLPSYNQGR